MDKLLSITLSLLLILSIISPLLTAAATPKAEDDLWTRKIHPVFLKKIMDMDDDEYVEAIIRLKPLPKDMAMNVKGHYRLAVDTLKWWAKITQAPVVKFITDNGGIVLRRFWIDNVIAVRVKVGLLKKIAMLPDVVEIFENFKVHILEPVEKKPLALDQEASSWGIFKIRANEAWAAGYTGEGVRIALIDTGVDISHPALQGKMLDVVPETPKYEGGWMEFDDYGNPIFSDPWDSYGHGTHTSGTALGGDTENILIGVAPGATLMHAMVFHGPSATFEACLAGIEWAVEPYYIDDEGNYVYTGLPAHVVSMSWGAAGYYGNEFLPAFSNMLLANIVPVAAIGNEGEGASSNPGNIWGVFGVGATDESDNVAYFSSGEVVNWPDPPEEWPFFDTYPSTYIKPDFSAPGVNIVSSVPGGGYEAWSGTSMATPHVSGTVALILQAAGWTDFDVPDTPEMVYLILNATAVDFGDPGQDTRYGWGRIDAYEAVQKALQYAKTTGVEGYVYDAVSNEPVVWATVTVNETGKTVKVNGSGYFRIPLDPGTYHLIFEAWGYEPQTLEVEVIALNGTIAGWVIDEVYGTPIEGAAVTVEELNLTVYTGADGGFSITVPPGTYTVTASAEGYESETQVVDVGENETVIVTFTLPPIGNGTIIGYVTDAETGEPIEGAVVWVYVDDVPVANYTDATGYYELNVPSGIYTVYVFAPGYESAEAQNVTVVPGGIVVVNFSLTPVPPVVVVLANVDYDTQPHLATIIASAGYPVVEYDSMEELLDDWAAGLINPKVIVLDHTEPDEYDYPDNDTFVAFLLLADASGTSLVWLGTSYSGKTAMDVLYMYGDYVEPLGYPAPDDYEYHYPSPEYVLVYMLQPDHPIFNGVVPDEDNWFYLADLENSDWADYKTYYFEDDAGLVELAYINDTDNDVYGGIGVAEWTTTTGVPWFYLGSWAESEWMQYLEPGSDGVYSNNTLTVLVNAVALGYGSAPTSTLSLDKARLLASLLAHRRGFEVAREVETDVYTYVEVYLERLPYGWVKGHVEGSDGLILAGATIEVLGTPVTMETDENGDFHFWLPAGNYTIVISKPGYADAIIEVTVNVNETTDLDTIVLQRVPRIAILYDYAGEIKAFIENVFGWYAKDYGNITELTEDLTTGFYDAVIHAGYYYAPMPSRTEFLEFYNTIVEYGINAIFLDQWSSPWYPDIFGYGIRCLNEYLGDPVSRSTGDTDYGVGTQLVITEMHPIFRGYEVGQVLDLAFNPGYWGTDYAYFSGFSGETIAKLVIEDEVYGDLIAWKMLETGSKILLMASFAPEEYQDMSYWSTDALVIFANAIHWIVQKPLNVWLENPYLHVGDEAVVHISGAPADTVLHVLLDGALVATVVSDEEGNATATFTVPLIPGGEHLVEVISADELYYGMTKLYVLAKIVVSPTETTSPGQIYVVATGLPALQKAYVYFDANYLTLIAANESGAFEAIINVPMVITGTHTVSLADPVTGEILHTTEIMVYSVFDNLTAGGTRLNEVLEKLNSIDAKLDLIIVDLSGLNETLYGVDGKIDQLIVDVDTVSGKLDSISSLLDSVTGSLDTVSGDVAYIKTELGTIATKINDLNATLVGLIITETGKVYALVNTSVGTITAKLDDLEELGLSVSDNISTVLNNLDTLNTKVDDLGAKIDDLDAKITEIYENLTSLIEKVKSDLSGEHSTIISKLDQLSSSVGQLSSKVKSIEEEKIPSVEQKVEDAKSSASTATNVGGAGLGLAVIALAAAIFGFVRKK